MAQQNDADSGWRKSSASGSSECVEVRVVDDRVHVRDSKNSRAAALTFDRGEWQEFLAGVRLGEFDLPTD